MPGITPTGVERMLAPEEIIVSKTDPRGHLTYVNDSFLAISAYTDEDLIGRPHNVIRHPDMPRSVFRLLWDTISAGEELFAYVVNLASDGAHYWVLAHVTPSFDESGAIIGYHSNRRAPSRQALQRIIPLYQSLVAEERLHANARDAAEAGMRKLEQVLRECGQTYEELVWSLITEEKVA